MATAPDLTETRVFLVSKGQPGSLTALANVPLMTLGDAVLWARRQFFAARDTDPSITQATVGDLIDGTVWWSIQAEV